MAAFLRAACDVQFNFGTRTTAFYDRARGFDSGIAAVGE